MRVKRLEIQGFKSFKDKTVIHFDHGITGIVGPNGCGKSNIVDAFFWVMGEQSYKHMRGSSSDDLIFNGSSKYNPLAMAEATLVMDTEASTTTSGATFQDIPVHLRSKEVSVTRRLYRTGEGEYFINGVPARLKDIHELFMDTGVGAKGYSVIEQGQIGKVVNAKPEDRRVLIEEAAGIAKYKARKKESLRKMEATQANLSRLNDVVQEIERQLASLERQAQKARQYRKHKDELLDKEMTWGRRKVQLIRQRLDEIRKSKEVFEHELLGLRAELQTAENSIEVDRIEQVTDTKLAEEMQLAIQSLSDELTRERSALELSRRRQTDLDSRLQSLGQERASLRESLAGENSRMEKKLEETSALEQSYGAAQAKAQGMDEKTRKLRQEAEATRRELDEAKRDLMNGLQNSSAFVSRDASLASRLESAGSRALKLSKELETRTQQLERCRAESEHASAAFTGIRVKRETFLQESRDQSERIQALEQASRQSERETEESLKSLTQAKSKLQSLEELVLAYEGFTDGPKSALEFLRERGGSVSAIADALETEPELEAALGGWLEHRLEDLILPCSSAGAGLAMGAIEKIRSDKRGRAVIHISSGGNVGTYNSIRFEYIRELLEAEGFDVRGELASLIRINPALSEDVREIAARSIAHVCVVKSMSPLASFVGRGSVFRLGHWSIVSLDGIALDQEGVLRGGSVENDGAASVLRRKRAISELIEQVERLETAHQKTEAVSTETGEALELARAGFQALLAKLQELEIQAAALDRDVRQSERNNAEAGTAIRSIQLEIDENTEEIAQATADRSSIENRLSAIVSARAELEARITERETLLASKEAEVRVQEFELQNLRIEEASLRERIQGLRREMESTKGLISDREGRLGDIEGTLEHANQERSQFTGGDSSLQRRIEDLTARLSDSRDELSTVKDRIEQSSAKVNAALDRIKELHKATDEKSTGLTQLALELEKLGSDLTHLIQNLEEKYGPGCLEKPVISPIQEEMSEPVVTREMTAEEEAALGEEVERLREKIRRLGEVNVEAIDDYEKLKKRYDYLMTEKSDLENSIHNLEEAIEHINKTSEDRFKRAFDAINDRFQRLFPIVFGGGGAHLSLVFPEGSSDVLEAGVDILAQPPGKKVSNITLLSGGEKALTAVSLIFAIFMVKPSPFCVLDEVDAPLDDGNIGKFNALLREMAIKSQFILITHNKKTMELNDTLYGVTMEEPGVSKMVSIEMQ